MKKAIVSIIDHTNIDPKAKEKDIIKTCQEAKKYGFRGVCVNPRWAKKVKEELKGTGIKTIVLIDPPIGDSPHSKRMGLVKKAKKDGADEVDVVMNICWAKHDWWDKILKDLKEICQILPTKVIIGSGYLTDQEILIASGICKKAGAFCVKTATFKDPLENRELKEKARHIRIMKEGASGLLIKASGKISSLKDLKMMLRAGADIIGTSYSLKIIKELERKNA